MMLTTLRREEETPREANPEAWALWVPREACPHNGDQRLQLAERRGQKDLLICYWQRLISKQFGSLC